MSGPKHIAVALAEQAWQRWEEASQRAMALPPGTQRDMFDAAHAERREWFGIAMACEREVFRHD